MSRRSSDKQARRRRRQQRAGRGRHLRAVGAPSTTIPAELDGPGSVPEMVRQRAAQPNPITLLEGASWLMSSTDPRLHRPDPFGAGAAAPEIDLETLLEVFLDIDAWELQTLARLVGHLTTDAGQARKVGRALAGRPVLGPAWLGQLDQIRPTRAIRGVEELGDADNVIVELSLPGGHQALLITLVDHNLGTAVKDSFAVPIGLEDYLAALADMREAQGIAQLPIELADARAFIEPALRLSLMLWPQPESETWPETLPLLEFVLGELPAGGEGYPELDQDEDESAREALVAELVAGPHWAWDHDGPQREAVDRLAWLHSTFFGQGLHRVSPSMVEAVMEDLWLRKTDDLDEESRLTLPEVYAAWTRFVHGRGGISAPSTTETLVTIEELADELRGSVTSGYRTPGVAELMAEQARLLSERAALHREFLVDRLGGEQAVDDLDDLPLPDEPFDVSAVPEEHRELVERLLGLAEPIALEMGGVEARTALRRITAELARTAAQNLTRGRDERRTAAALLWVMGHTSSLFGSGAAVGVGDLMARLGLTGSPSQRGNTMLGALGWSDSHDAAWRVTRPEWVHSSHRAQLVRLRDG